MLECAYCSYSIILIKIVFYAYSLSLYYWTFTVAEKPTSTS